MIEESQLSNEKARFIHAYNALVKREEDYMALPERTRAAIEGRNTERLDNDSEVRYLLNT